MSEISDRVPQVKEIVAGDGLVLARLVPAAIAWRDGLTFFSSDDEFIQVGTWGYDAGKKMPAHTHNEVKREIAWTQETLFIYTGRIKVLVYDRLEQLQAEWIAAAGDIVVLLRGGHGYEILENGTRVLEIKNGPYVGAERDRRRF